MTSSYERNILDLDVKQQITNQTKFKNYQKYKSILYKILNQ